MANDAFKPEIPEPLRELMKMSIEQAKRAFEAFISTSEKTWKSLEDSSSPAGRASLYALNAKIAEITRRNAEANFALAMKLAESKDVSQAMELQSRHVKQQMETFVHQLEEMRDLTAQIIQEANPARTDVSSARGGPAGSARPSGAEQRRLLPVRAVVELSARRDRPHLLVNQRSPYYKSSCPATRVRLRQPEHRLRAGHPRISQQDKDEDVDGRAFARRSCVGVNCHKRLRPA